MRTPQKLDNPTMEIGLHCWSKGMMIGGGFSTYSH